ncbi:proline dehydrogenase family protein [Kineococcus arenarius]|uniref:proline dehydrogenase family protein n=1 Tax=unclassified Kineococcus TaxID=2621656 RepID=UPI003D7CDF5E
MISALLLRAAENRRLERLATGNPLSRGIVQRYVAGTTLAEAIAVAQQAQRKNMQVSLDLLGESVQDLAEAATATEEYVQTVRAIAAHAPGATVSVKLSQLGVAVDEDTCLKNLEHLMAEAASVGVLVEVDMEHSSVGRATLELFRRVLPSYPDSRIAIQAAMRRTVSDLESFDEVKPRIRLVKGAYAEPLSRAASDPDEIAAQYAFLTDWALQNLPDPAFGTHDDRCIEHVKLSAGRLGVLPRDYEFQMLYGVRRDLQEQLAEDGYRVRLYVPFGTQWYPYLMRRMAERPANLLLFLRSLVGG